MRGAGTQTPSPYHKILYSLWGLFFAYWFISSLFNRSSAARKEPLLSRILYLALLGLAIALIAFDPLILGPLLGRLYPEGIAVGLVGLVITLAGLGFAIWARIHLGRYWSARVALSPDHQLIQTGPYHIVRNPIYSGGLLAIIGTAIVIGEVKAFLAIALALIAFLRKIWVEEKWLRERFGQQYVDYQKKVKGLIPYIW